MVGRVAAAVALLPLHVRVAAVVSLLLLLLGLQRQQLLPPLQRQLQWTSRVVTQTRRRMFDFKFEHHHHNGTCSFKFKLNLKHASV
jgi:hypothetical protein